MTINLKEIQERVEKAGWIKFLLGFATCYIILFVSYHLSFVDGPYYDKPLKSLFIKCFSFGYDLYEPSAIQIQALKLTEGE